MKKILSLALAAALLLSMAACTPAADTNTTAATEVAKDQLLVGYGRADVTPRDSVPLQGYGTTEKRMSTGFLNLMYIIAVAITDPAGETAIIMSADACYISATDATQIRNSVASACKISADKVIISAIHQHSAPDMANPLAPSGITYKERVFIPGAVEAAKAAMEDRAATTAVQIATVETENLNYIRHYILDDGSYAGNNFGDMTAFDTERCVSHASENDNTMQLVKFVRKGQTTQADKEAKNIILANFQGHPLKGVDGNWNLAHSDVPGIFREELEKELDCYSIYFSGASGNVAMNSEIPAEEAKTPKDFKAHGRKLAKYAINAEDSYTDISLTAVKGVKVGYDAEHYCVEDAALVAKATEAWDLYAENGSQELVQKYGFQSIYEAHAIQKAGNRAAGTTTVEIFALSFGDLAIIAAPYEMFCASGMNIKAGSPFKMTLVSTIANGGHGYFPTEYAWDYGCYEQYSSNYVRGTAEALETEHIQMLKDLHCQYE